MNRLTGIFVVGLLSITVMAHAQYGSDPYTPTGPSSIFGWQNYFSAANAQVAANARASAPANQGTNGTPAPPPPQTGSSSSVQSFGYTPLPIHIAIPRHPFLPSIRVNEDETSLYCLTGTVLSIAGKGSTDSYNPPALEVDRRRFASDEICRVTGQYLFYWKAFEPGLHTLRIMVTPADGSVPIVSRMVRVVVSDNAPVSLTSLPAMCDADTTAPISRINAADFHPVKAAVIVNNASFDIDGAQKSLAIPASKMPDGDYAFSMASFEADGTRFVAMPQTVHIQHGKGPNWSVDDVQPKR